MGINVVIMDGNDNMKCRPSVMHMNYQEVVGLNSTLAKCGVYVVLFKSDINQNIL